MSSQLGVTGLREWQGLPVISVPMWCVLPHAGPGRILTKIIDSIANEGMKNPLLVTHIQAKDYVESLVDENLKVLARPYSYDQYIYTVWTGNNRWAALKMLGYSGDVDVVIFDTHTEAIEFGEKCKLGWNHIYEVDGKAKV